MGRTKIATVVGARPQFVKLAGVSHLLRESFDEILIHTGQHYDYEMSRVFFEELRLPEPTVHLGIGSGGGARKVGSPAATWQLGEMTKAAGDVLARERPAGVLVYGDTTSTLAGALAGAKLDLPVAHVEAGLRSFNRRMPEELNRVLTDHASALLFAPTSTAVGNLGDEGITAGVHRVGDVMRDVFQTYAPLAEDAAPVRALGLEPGGYFVATVHRAENTDDGERLRAILGGLARAPLPVAFPVHPRTRRRMGELAIAPGGALRALDPLGYLAMLRLMRHARCVVTDSGGVQKEATFLGVPCLTLRDETEWVETVRAGWNRLVPADADAIAEAMGDAAAATGRPTGTLDHEYGTGAAGREIVRLLREAWG